VIFGTNELESQGYRMALFAWSYRFNHLRRTPTCDRRTDRRTDTRWQHIPQ